MSKPKPKPKGSAFSLSDVLAKSVAGASPTPEAQDSQPPEPEAPHATDRTPVGVPVTFLVTAEDRKRLRHLSTDAGMSIQQLSHRAWNLLLAERGLADLEPLTANRPSGRRRV